MYDKADYRPIVISLWDIRENNDSTNDLDLIFSNFLCGYEIEKGTAHVSIFPAKYLCLEKITLLS